MTLADVPVELRGGLSVALPAYWLALDLEARGGCLRCDGGAVLADPADCLTDDHRAVLDRYQGDVRALVAYLGRPALDAHLFSPAGATDAECRRPA